MTFQCEDFIKQKIKGLCGRSEIIEPYGCVKENLEIRIKLNEGQNE